MHFTIDQCIELLNLAHWPKKRNIEGIFGQIFHPMTRLSGHIPSDDASLQSTSNLVFPVRRLIDVITVTTYYLFDVSRNFF